MLISWMWPLRPGLFELCAGDLRGELRISHRGSDDTLRRLNNDSCVFWCLSKIAHLILPGTRAKHDIIEKTPGRSMASVIVWQKKI